MIYDNANLQMHLIGECTNLQLKFQKQYDKRSRPLKYTLIPELFSTFN